MIGTGLIATPIAKVRTSLIPCPMSPLSRAAEALALRHSAEHSRGRRSRAPPTASRRGPVQPRRSAFASFQPAVSAHRTATPRPMATRLHRG